MLKGCTGEDVAAKMSETGYSDNKDENDQPNVPSSGKRRKREEDEQQPDNVKMSRLDPQHGDWWTLL